MVIKKKDDAPGYIYFIKFNRRKNCYKIGSTGNVFGRMNNFRQIHEDIELVAYGYASDRLLIEKQIQYLFSDFSNNGKYFHNFPKPINFEYVGSITSTENFIFNISQVCDVIMVFDLLCNSVQIGTDHPDYCVKPHRQILGYGEEALNFYDCGQDRYVPYPTEFRNGYPVYLPVEEWNNVPKIKGAR